MVSRYGRASWMISDSLANMVAAHLSVIDLEAHYRAASDAKSARPLQTIWLLAKGHALAEMSSTTTFGVRWIEKLLPRYKAEGPDALGDRRRHNATGPTVLKPSCSTSCGSVWRSRRRIEGCGRAGKSQLGWPESWG